MKAASRLKVAQENWETDRSDFDGAVAYNRKLWTILAAAATEVDNDLPPDLKRNMALIAVFVFNRSLDMITDPKPSGLDAMIEINRNIATGLSAPPPV